MNFELTYEVIDHGLEICFDDVQITEDRQCALINEIYVDGMQITALATVELSKDYVSLHIDDLEDFPTRKVLDSIFATLSEYAAQME